MKRFLPLLILAGVLLACSSTESDWQKASTANTVQAYQQFLQSHATGDHADEARSRIRALQDDQAWMEAMNTNTTESFQQYLQKEPMGTHAQQARDRITALQRASDWQVAQASGSAAALQSFLQKYPTGPEADQARARLDSDYQVQLAEYHTKREADHAVKRLESRYGKVVHGLTVSTGTDKLNQVHSAPMSLANAQAACTTVEKSGQHCEVVKVAQR